MKALLSAATLITLLVAAGAQAACPVPRLEDFTVYMVADLTGVQSDFQGLTGAGGTVTLQDFYIGSRPAVCQALASGNTVSIERATVAGPAEVAGHLLLVNARIQGSALVAGSVELLESSIKGQLTSPNRPTLRSSDVTSRRTARPALRVDHGRMAADLLAWNQSLAARSVTGTAMLQGSTMTISGPSSEVAVSIGAADLERSSTILVQASAQQTVVINILGTSARLEHKMVRLLGGIDASRVFWNFVGATQLTIRNTADASMGWPGTVIAPTANVLFVEGLITGALWGGRLLAPQAGERTGQVNNAIDQGQRPYN